MKSTLVTSALRLSVCATVLTGPSVAAPSGLASAADRYANDQAACRKSASQTTRAAVAEEPHELNNQQIVQEYFDAIYALCMAGRSNKVPGWQS